MTIQHFIAPATLPFPNTCGIPAQASLSVLSYNVLLPNSQDGWWNYKMYSPPLLSEEEQYYSTWEYRQELLKQKIQKINADVVCFQEVSPQSFAQDFLFMKEELGYHGCEMFKRGRFRPATFWKTDKCTLVGSPVHKDRTLLTVFQLNHNNNNNNNNNNMNENDEEKKEDTSQQQIQWHVLNCHLQAGLQAPRRLRQIEDGIKASCKFANDHYKKIQQANSQSQSKKNKKHKDKDNPKSSVASPIASPSPHLIVCGDFNGGAECAAVRYLEDGSVTPEFLEDGKSTTSKLKTLPATIPAPSHLLDVFAAVNDFRQDTNTNVKYNQDQENDNDKDKAPPTMVVQELISNMVHPDSEEGQPKLSDPVLECLERIYHRFATHTHEQVKVNPNTEKETKAKQMQMNVENVEQWLIAINGKLGRGSEFRAAAAEMGWKAPPEEEDLPKEERSPIVLPPNSILTLEGFQNVYQLELQQGKFWGIAHDLAVLGEPLPDAGLYVARFDRMYCTSNLRPYAAIDTLSDIPCPNSVEPSDHLPIAASFTLN